jgi:hygromycin-B 4-O-kinase
MPHSLSQSQAEAFLVARYGDVQDVRPLTGGFWSAAFAFQHAGRELVLRFGSRADWFEADRIAATFASPSLPVPEVLEVGEALDSAYAISVRFHGMNLEDVRPDQSDAANLLLTALLGALYDIPNNDDMPVRWHAGAPASGVTWRGWLSERLAREAYEQVRDWTAALGPRDDIDRLWHAGEARVRDLIDACPERRDLVHGDLLHANVLVAGDASKTNAVFSWKNSVRGDFLYDTAWCTFCSAIWYPGIAAADPWASVQRALTARNDATAWVDAPARHHCYEMLIGLTALVGNLRRDDATTAAQIARQLAVVLERGPLTVSRSRQTAPRTGRDRSS